MDFVQGEGAELRAKRAASILHCATEAALVPLRELRQGSGGAASSGVQGRSPPEKFLKKLRQFCARKRNQNANILVKQTKLNLPNYTHKMYSALRISQNAAPLRGAGHRSTFCLKPTFPWIIAKNLTLVSKNLTLVSKIRQFLQYYGLFQNEDFWFSKQCCIHFTF